jgi:deazaflavin-dependent oxidoreductase (nitroreductase family)
MTIDVTGFFACDRAAVALSRRTLTRLADIIRRHPTASCATATLTPAWPPDSPVAPRAGSRKPVPTLLLEHRGRKSGRLFTTPQLYLEDGHVLVVVASQGGLPNNPQWHHNLAGRPETRVHLKGRRFWNDRSRSTVAATPGAGHEHRRLCPSTAVATLGQTAAGPNRRSR